MVTKAHILQEIKRTAEANDGKPLGAQRFESETGIKPSDWKGRYWARWGDANREAGYTPNELSKPGDNAMLLQKYAEFAQELGHLPVDAELSLKRRNDCAFPSPKAFRQFGTKLGLVQRVGDYCLHFAGYKDVVRLCQEYASQPQHESDNEPDRREDETGFVYLIKAGRF